jgi:hypothetical protein
MEIMENLWQVGGAEFTTVADADILCEGHFGIYRGKEEVKKIIGSFLVD